MFGTLNKQKIDVKDMNVNNFQTKIYRLMVLFWAFVSVLSVKSTKNLQK